MGVELSMGAPPKFEYCVDDDGKFHIPEDVRSYLGTAGMAGAWTEWDPEVDMGTRGDSKEILDLEIQASALDDRTKENLLYNLEGYPRDSTKRSRFFPIVLANQELA